MFLDTVVHESRRLIESLDRHLPHALSQARSEHPRPSRFDYFCASLRQIEEDELENNREKYGAVIRESFSGILISEVKRLIEVVDPGPNTIATSSENPTGLRFGLEAETDLKLAFLANKTVWAERLEMRYRRSLGGAKLLLTVAAAASVIFLVLSLVFRAPWSKTAATVAMISTACFGILGLLAVLLSLCCESKLKWAAQKEVAPVVVGIRPAPG
jgi:hypothetical protein